MLAVRRVESRYRSSYPLEELLVQTTHGQLEMIWKRVAPHELSEAAVPPSRRSSSIPVERSTRTEICSRRSELVHVCTAPIQRAGWLFLARVPGVELYQIGHPPVWQQVAAWLAGMHHQFTRVSGVGHAPSRVVRYDRQFYRRFMERALARTGRVAPERPYGDFPQCTTISSTGWSNSLRRSCTASSTCRTCSSTRRRSGWRCGRSTGRWPPLAPHSSTSRRSSRGAGAADNAALIADAYRHAGTDGIDRRTFRDALACCRLQLCIQWLGWSDSWTPPPQHAHDWLAEACELLEEIAW